MKRRFRDRLVNAIICYAQGTPYYHIGNYMNRWWLLGADSIVRNEHNELWGQYKRYQVARDRSRLYQWITKHLAARVHETLRSDNDRHLHDHPSWNISIVLRGGYYEVMPVREGVWAGDREETIRKWRGPGSVVFRRATSRHKLILPIGESSWSIFILGKKKRNHTWGFYTRQGKIPWHVYLGVKETQE